MPVRNCFYSSSVMYFLVSLFTILLKKMCINAIRFRPKRLKELIISIHAILESVRDALQSNVNWRIMTSKQTGPINSVTRSFIKTIWAIPSTIADISKRNAVEARAFKILYCRTIWTWVCSHFLLIVCLNETWDNVWKCQRIALKKVMIPNSSYFDNQSTWSDTDM